ncbi:SpoIIE family protein phosphatase [Planomonospora sp. ID82291]|uniref:ATP-binding SpoIIE family protein phosphatase n=1 Tax=Planomonospora sp. ID82291 TaxID=2738136 RepID=UPI0018C3E37B|nr:SpoIIE family protein phosphatase [Planomonospora sp. ID82291]MBG0816080.1 SpoIIE family protein phosphatase [Planomonospora sp. ID82291]
MAISSRVVDDAPHCLRECPLTSAAVRDLTDREAAEQRFRSLLESAPDAMVIVDGAGTITLVNAQTEQVFGYDRGELLGRPVEMLVPARFRDLHAVHRDDYAANQQVRPMGAGLELYGLRKDGREFPVEISLSPLETADGLLVSAAVRDVTDRRRAQEELTRLYEQQRHVALTLQRSLMGTPSEPSGIDTASRYLPAGAGAGVGGDWFDLIPLTGGQVGILIGDVMGRGLEAAAVMGQLRSAARALAMTAMSPQQVMQALDAFVTDLPDQLVTCCYLVVDPTARTVTVCSAGHLPILLVDPDDRVHRLPAPISVPLGVGGVDHRQVRLEIVPESTLVLYTDGLVETPRSDIEVQLAALADRLRTAFRTTSDLQQAADQVLSALLPDTTAHADDVTLLLARIPTAPPPTAQTRLDGHPAAVGAARRFLTATLRSWHCAQLTDTACLLASELLTNTVRHTRGPATLRLLRTRDGLTVEVTDHSADLPRPRRARSTDEAGRGLAILQALADAWGAHPTATGKTVWFSLRLPSPPPDPLPAETDAPM